MTAAATLPGLKEACAGSFYVETGAGFSQFRGGDNFFGSGIPSVTSLGFGFNAGVFWNISSPTSIAEFHFGIQDRVSQASSGNINASIHAPYVVARAQLSKIYFGFGVSPMVWRRVMDYPSLSDFSKAPSTYAALIESGLLWAVTPEFSLGTTLGTQWIFSNGQMGPKPALEGVGFMRFYFGFTGNQSGGSRSSGEFKGWRYPFGWELRGS